MAELISRFAKLFVLHDILLHFEVTNLKEDHDIVLIELVEKGDASHIQKEIVREEKVVKEGYMNSND
ncbi:MAG: hypothetical protein ACI86M_000198 [Saprospiraceae bacterium]